MNEWDRHKDDVLNRIQTREREEIRKDILREKLLSGELNLGHKTIKDIEEEITETLQLKSHLYKGDPGVCSSCRNPALRDKHGDTFHPPGTIPKGERCPSGTEHVNKIDPEDAYAAIGSWSARFSAPLVGVPEVDWHRIRVDIPDYCFFDLDMLE